MTSNYYTIMKLYFKMDLVTLNVINVVISTLIHGRRYYQQHIAPKIIDKKCAKE
jgi:hypothetical protein